VKFAEALSDAGHEVILISVPVLDDIKRMDALLASGRKWMHKPSETRPTVPDRILARLSSMLWKVGVTTRFSHEWCGGTAVGPLFRAAIRHESVDLVMAFNLPALAVALRLKALRGWQFHFDSEDDHVEVLPDNDQNRSERSRRAALVQRGALDAHSCSSAAPMMASDLQSSYGRAFDPILNTFDPLATQARRTQGSSDRVRFVWHSQTIGPGRGLEQFMPIIAKVPECDLYLRGMVSEDYRESLVEAARSCGIESNRLHFLELVPASELIARLVQFDIGIALETNTTRNRRHCLSNKVFEYIAAGLPIVLSDTPAQRELARDLGASAILIDLEDPSRSGDRLADWLREPTALDDARTKVVEELQNRFNWKIESKHLLSLIESADPRNT